MDGGAAAPAAGGPQGVDGYVPDPWGTLTQDSHILGTGQYDYGDFLHDHHRRHHHRFHDHHYVQGANETLDLSNVPQVQSHVIPAAQGTGAQFTLRPDVMGKWAFENGAAAYGFGIGFAGITQAPSQQQAPPPTPPQATPPQVAYAPSPQTPSYPTHPPQATTPRGVGPLSGSHRSIMYDNEGRSMGPGGGGYRGGGGPPSSYYSETESPRGGGQQVDMSHNRLPLNLSLPTTNTIA